MGSGESDDAFGPTVGESSNTGRDPTLPAASTGSEGPRSASAGRYQLGAQLGRGGMGEVLSARDDQIGRAVAIKRMRDASPDARTVARFFREARIQGQLDHPAIVPVHELSHDAEGRPFFAMKQLAGVTLADVIGMTLVEDPETLAKFTRQRLLRAFAEVCLAIEFAHKKRIIHRDLKPANVMLGDYGEVYVLDWGIARRLDDALEDSMSGAREDGGHDAATVAGAMLGTPGYMSPEQIRGETDLDGRADVFALGCMLFEILALEPLYARGTAGLEAALGDSVERRPSVRAPDRDVPPELDTVCAKATAPERADRHASARALSDAVQRYLDGDRDIALRRDHARRELAAARAILDGGLLSTMSHSRQQQRVPRPDEIDAYASAFRAAGRALALDPKSTEAAEVVSRLMIEPPAELPPEVEGKLAELEDDQLRVSARFGVRATIGYFMFFPVIWLAGVHAPWVIFGGFGVTLAITVGAALIAETPSSRNIFITLLANCALVAIYACGLTPLLIAPGAALITTMLFAAHPRLRPAWLLWLCCTAAVVAPLALEAIGVLSTTTSIEGSRIVLQLPTDHLDPAFTLFGLGGYVVVILAIATIVVRGQALDQQRSRRQVQIQAWKLDQLVKAAA